MRTWIRPAAAAENYLVNQSVSNGPCMAIACNVNDANRYEETLGLHGTSGWNDDFKGYVNHTVGDTVNGGCGTAANNALIVQNGKVIGMKEINNKVGSNALNCTMYTDGTYKTPATNIGFAVGKVIYWTTESTSSGSYSVNWYKQPFIRPLTQNIRSVFSYT